MRPRALFLALLLVAACGSSSGLKTGAPWADARLRGQIAPDSAFPNEVRVLLDPSYRRLECDGDEVPEGYAEPEQRFAKVEIDPSGSFASPLFVVRCTRWSFRKLAPPTFFVSFDNEQDTFYAIGDHAGAVQWRTYSMASKERIPREEACWRVLSGSYVRPDRRSVELSVIFRDNPASSKPCQRPGR